MKYISLKILLIGSLVIAILIPAFFTIQNLLADQPMKTDSLVGSLLFSFTISVLIYLANGTTVMYLQQKFDWNKKALKLFTIELLWTSLNAAVLMTIVFLTAKSLLDENMHGGDNLIRELFNHIVIALIFNTIALAFLEARSFFLQWKKSLVETEQLKRESIENQFAALKNQVSPHFLFNNLNTLSSLIDESPEKAQVYLAKMAGIYRYILEVRDEYVIDLNSELKFLDDYIYMHKVRYGDNMVISKRVDAAMLPKMIPVLSLQMLVENTIKHNEISDKRPLKIRIFTENGFLVIKNSLQQKRQAQQSTGVGLENLKDRYRYLSDQVPEFYIEENLYIAKIPLLDYE